MRATPIPIHELSDLGEVIVIVMIFGGWIYVIIKTQQVSCLVILVLVVVILVAVVVDAVVAVDLRGDL